MRKQKPAESKGLLQLLSWPPSITAAKETQRNSDKCAVSCPHIGADSPAAARFHKTVDEGGFFFSFLFFLFFLQQNQPEKKSGDTQRLKKKKKKVYPGGERGGRFLEGAAAAK